MKENPFKLGVEDIPLVEEYKYLGYNFNVSLKNTHIIKAREEAGRKVLAKLYPFITNKEIPVHAKISVIRSYLIPVITYGGEFFGLESTQTLNSLENILIDALRGVAMGSLGKAGAGFNLLKEFNFHPITVIVAIARIRLFNKITKGRFKTVIGSLFIGNATNHMGNWGIKTRSWLAKRNLLVLMGDTNELLRTVKYTMIDEVWTAANIKLTKENSLTHSGYAYHMFEFIASRDYIYQDKGLQYQKGLSMLSGLRTGSFWTCLRLTKTFRNKYEDWRDSCPFCKMDQAESMEHIPVIISCLKWN
jgi:hypothetical protein